MHVLLVGDYRDISAYGAVGPHRLELEGILCDQALMGAPTRGSTTYQPPSSKRGLWCRSLPDESVSIGKNSNQIIYCNYVIIWCLYTYLMNMYAELSSLSISFYLSTIIHHLLAITYHLSFLLLPPLSFSPPLFSPLCCSAAERAGARRMEKFRPRPHY